MRTKRLSDANICDIQIAKHKVLFILPKQSSFPVAVEDLDAPGPVAQQQNAHVPFGGKYEPHYEGVICGFIQNNVHALYDTLELLCI